MSKWFVSEQGICDENGCQIIEASEWYMRKQLETICKEHNAIEQMKSKVENKSMAVYAIYKDETCKDFIELAIADTIEEMFQYCDKKYGDKAQPIAMLFNYDVYGNLCHVRAEDVIRPEFKKHKEDFSNA